MALPVRNSALDRDVQFAPNRILKAQELEMLQALFEKADQYGIGSLYRNGATFNVAVNINGGTISLAPQDPAVPMYVFLRSRFEQLDPVSFNFARLTNLKILLEH